MTATAVDQCKRFTHTYASIDALPKSSRASASLHFFFFSICVFITKDSPGPSGIAQPDTTYAINTSERHKSGLGMRHGNHFLFLLRAAPGVRRTLPLPPLRLCLHTWTFVCGVPWYTARAPSDHFSRLREKRHRPKERFGKCLRFERSSMALYLIHSKSVEAHNGICIM